MKIFTIIAGGRTSSGLENMRGKTPRRLGNHVTRAWRFS
jgi:hypothetical protein